MDNANQSIPELVAARKALAREQSEINRKLEQLDIELFSRLESALEAFGIKAPTNGVQSPQASLPMPASASALPPAPPPWQINGMQPTARQGEIGYVLQKTAMEALARAGKPLKTSEIYDELQRRGVDIPGKDPRNNLSAHLSRSDVFMRTATGWWFAKTRAPQLGGS